MKKAIKKNMLDKRNSLSLDCIKEYSSRICSYINSLDVYKNAKTVALFYPLGSEINLLELFNMDKQFVFPKVSNDSMDFFLVDSLDSFSKGFFNIMEPVSNNRVLKTDIDLIIVPLLAYDNNLNRIGYGKGFYDRYLKDYKGFKMGVAFPFSLVEDTYCNEFDVRLDMVVIV